MKTLSHVPAIILVMLSLVNFVHAQTVYRCGNTYSQQPCPEGKAIDASDSRTAEQRKRHDQSVQHEKRTADALEKKRIAEETAAVRSAQQADQAQRAAEKNQQKKPVAAKPKNQHAKDKLPAYRAPVAPREHK